MADRSPCDPRTACAVVTFTVGAALFAAGAFVGLLAGIVAAMVGAR
jgi:hypothetical protein